MERNGVEGKENDIQKRKMDNFMDGMMWIEMVIKNFATY
jgi:hypothetical protein